MMTRRELYFYEGLAKLYPDNLKIWQQKAKVEEEVVKNISLCGAIYRISKAVLKHFFTVQGPPKGY
jgi:hypothetical protein